MILNQDSLEPMRTSSDELLIGELQDRLGEYVSVGICDGPTCQAHAEDKLGSSEMRDTLLIS